ncbi:hypothetical protein [Roseomonas sp. CECT 9278]|uniref:hypothetical protein n=1 Tax=Roseomonas sp. CECT 9278 TaxID=2845823 RepID=UPI001E40D3FB|nr:hypothetical protein [Roseomonas sp. CECT 9278]CAH0292611.1 hypothetical protein ROS9278_04276 [Roseomonas sp. CECT 9278]
MSATYASDAGRVVSDGVVPVEGRRGQALGAVVIGTAVALAAGAALTALGVAIGAGTVDAVARDTPDATSFATAGGAWITVAQVVAVGAGAFVAGRLAHAGLRGRGGLHGLGVWAFTVVVSLSLLGGAVAGVGTAVGSAIGGTAQAVASGAGAAVGAAAQTIDPRAAVERVRAALAAPQDPARMTSEQRAAALTEVLARGVANGTIAEQDRARAAALVAAEAGITEAEARQRIDTYEAEARRTAAAVEQRAREAADATARATKLGAIWAFVTLLLGAGAAFLGGRAGAAGAARAVVTHRIA